MGTAAPIIQSSYWVRSSLAKYRENLQRLNQQRQRVIVLGAVNVADPAGV